MIDEDSPYHLELSEGVREEVEAEICRRVCSAISGAEARNSQLQIWRDQLQGFGITASNKNWSNACDFYDSISLEMHLTLLSQLVGALHRDPKVAIEAFSKDEEEGARILEAYLSMESSKNDIDTRLYEMATDACWSQAAVTYAGWQQKTRQSREVGYRKSGDARVYSDEEREDGEEYEEVPVSEEVTEEGFDIRVVDLSDFYLYPANAKSVAQATAIAERMLLTEGDLYDGIDDYGFDRGAVEELCSLGPEQEPDELVTKNEQDGVESAPGRDGYYEVFTVYTRMPRTADGGDKPLPEHYLQDDFLVVCVPERRIVLKMGFSPYKERPYFTCGIMPLKDTILGVSLMGILEAIQTEANANIQFTVDMMNLTATPAILIPDSEAENFNKQTLQPGAVIKVNSPADVVPLEWDRSPLRDGLAWQQDLRNRATSLVSAQGQGQLQNKVRKAGEIQNIETQAAAKFGLYLSNFQRTGVAELFRRMIALKTQFGDVDDDGEEFTDEEGHSHTLTAKALKGKYNVVAVGTSLTHSPESRIEVGKQKQAIQSEYLMAKTKLPPDLSKLAWHGARELLFDMGERNPEAWIGEEPKEVPPQDQQPAQPQPGGPPQGQPGQQGPPQQPGMNQISNQGAQ